MKSGVKTSEFWIVAGANVIALLTLSGVFAQVDAPEITENFSQAVGGIFGVIANVTYILSRTVIKKTQPAPSVEGGQ